VPTAELADVLEEALWDTLKHPRGRGGKWIDKVGGEVAGAAKQVGRSLERPEIVRKDREFKQSEAFRRARMRPSYHTEFGRHGDELMYDLAVDKGFAGRPHVVSSDELEQHIADGDKEMWRGVTDESYAQLFTTGTAFYGQGFRGNGIYAAHGERAKKLATAYAQAPPTKGTLVHKVDKPVLIRMALRRDARTITYDEAALQAKSEHRKWAGLKGGGEGFSAEGAQALAAANSTATRWAMANGYDAVIIPKEDGGEEVAVLNRTALIVAGDFEGAGTNVTQQLREDAEDDSGDR
jgi:hypothetical protein